LPRLEVDDDATGGTGREEEEEEDCDAATAGKVAELVLEIGVPKSDGVDVQGLSSAGLGDALRLKS
jgi:hypothetical protein